MNRKIIILVMAVILAISIPVFAEGTANTTEPGIKPDSPLYIFDKLVEKIQIAIITDAVKEAEALAAIAQERLAEGKAMAEESNLEKATEAINEYKELMDKAINIIDAAAKDGKAVAKTIDMIAKYNIDDDEILDKLIDKVPEEYKEELKKAVEALPEKDAVNADDNKEKQEQAKKVSVASALLTGKVQDKALLEKIQNAGLNNRQISALVSMSEQSDKDLSEVVDLFLTNSKGIGKTIMELELAPKNAMKGINKTFKEVKKEIKSGLAESEELDKGAPEKLEKKVEKATEKLEKKIEKTEEKYKNKFDKKLEKAGKDKEDKED
jgi:hypothetical protein